MQGVSGVKGGLFVCFSDRPRTAAQEPDLCGDSLDWQLTLPPLPSWLEGQRLWWLSKQRNVRVQTLSESPSFHSPYLSRLSHSWSLKQFLKVYCRTAMCFRSARIITQQQCWFNEVTVSCWRKLHISLTTAEIHHREISNPVTHIRTHKGLGDKEVWAHCICWRQQ